MKIRLNNWSWKQEFSLSNVFLLNRLDEVACADPDVCKQVCGNAVGCFDIAYAKLVMELLPAGERLLLKLHPLFCTLLWCKNPRHILFPAGLCIAPARTAGPDDGRDDRCTRVVSDLHLQQRQHPFYNGLMEDFQISCYWMGAHDCWQVCHHMWTCKTKLNKIYVVRASILWTGTQKDRRVLNDWRKTKSHSCESSLTENL